MSSFKPAYQSISEVQSLLTDIFSGTTVNIERVVAQFTVGVGCFEKKSIGTELLFWCFSYTFIILVALFRVGEESIFLWTSEERI